LFGGRSARGWGPVPGADQTAEIELTVADAYHGGRRSVTIGSGSSQRRLDVTIPRGVIDGQLVRRLVALGVLDASRDSTGHLWFARSQLAAVARVQRLRAGFALNYAATGLVIDLLDRIAVLEAAVRRSSASI
jgi:hypothetical protein